MTDVRNFIRGEWISKREGREIEVRNPADQDELLGKGILASAREAEAAIAAASEALPAWARMPAPKRGEIVERSGVPPGVLNLLVGSSSDIGDLLTRDKRVRGISFTGSSENGTQIYTTCAARGAKSQCEMGGKNPVVVLEDADVALAADGIVSGAFGSTGQRCTATSRAIVEESVADELINQMVTRVSKWKLGNGLDLGVQMGPLVSAQQRQTVEEYIEIGKREGAKLVIGGGRPSSLPRGFFVEPTIFDRVPPQHRIAREEIFRPALSVIREKDCEQALEFANTSDYGLTSSIYTNDAGRIFDFF